MKDTESTSYSLELINVHKTYKSYYSRGGPNRGPSIFTRKKRKVKVLSNINIAISKGENIGIIGSNGSGKSTLMNIMMGSINPDKGGIVRTQGKMIKLALGLGIDKNLSARDNIYINSSLLGLTFKEIGELFDSIIDFAGIQDFIDMPVKFYSKGMRQRLLFSIAMNANADVYLLDEFFGGVGDKEFRRKSNIAFKKKILEGNTTIIISHSMSIINNYCDRVLWIEKGVIREYGEVNRIVDLYVKFMDSL